MRSRSFVNALLASLLCSSLFVSAIAVLLTAETMALLEGHIPTDGPLLAFQFFATLSAYNLHWLWTPLGKQEPLRKQWLAVWPSAHHWLVFTGAAGCLATLFLLQANLLIILPAILLTFLYTAPKSPYPLKGINRFAFPKTVYLAAVWAYVTTLMPLIYHSHAWDNEDVLFSVARFFLFYAICLLFDWRDRESDACQGIHSMVQLLTPNGLNIVFTACLLLYGISILYLGILGWPPKEILSLLLPVCLGALLFTKAKHSHSEILFYGLLDGLLIVPACLRFFLSF